MTDVLTNGMTLKLERIARYVKATDLAARMGVSRAYLSQLEARGAIQPEAADRYRKALATFPSLTSPAEPPEAA